MHFADVMNALYQRGAKGAEVRLLQKYLVAAGFKISVDGSYGPATENAIKEFQARYNIPVTGIVYQDTFEALANVADAYTAAGTVSVATGGGSTPVIVEQPAAPLPPLALPGTLPPELPKWVLIGGSTLSLLAFAWLLTRKAPRPALAGYRRRRRSRR